MTRVTKAWFDNRLCFGDALRNRKDNYAIDHYNI